MRYNSGAAIYLLKMKQLRITNKSLVTVSAPADLLEDKNVSLFTLLRTEDLAARLFDKCERDRSLRAPDFARGVNSFHSRGSRFSIFEKCAPINRRAYIVARFILAEDKNIFKPRAAQKVLVPLTTKLKCAHLRGHKSAIIDHRPSNFDLRSYSDRR